MKKWVAAAAVCALLTTGCEEAFNSASGGLDDPQELPTIDPGQTGVERNVDTTALGDPRVGEPGDPVTLPAPPQVSIPILETDGLTLIWATDRNGPAAGDLASATIGEPFEVRLEVTDETIDRVEWYIDDVLFRDDDIQAPFNLRYTGVLPIDGEFDSDQGLDNSWLFEPGETYAIQAIVHRGDLAVTIEAEFTIEGAAAPAPTTTAPPATTTTAPPATTTAPPATTTTAPPATTTTAPPATTTTAPPSSEDGRPIVMANASTVLDQPNTIYDFNFSSPGEVVIEASNVEARNIRGGGARRIGVRNGESFTDSGFRNFEFTFAHIQMSDGATVTRPYFIDGTDVNSQPNVGDGDIMQLFAYEGDIVDPLIDGVTIYGKRRPNGSDAHNDGIQFTGMSGGEVVNPTIRNSTVYGASSAAIQAKHVVGLFTIENTTLSEEFESYHAVIAKPGNSSSQMLWRNNTLLDGASVAATDGWSVHPSSNGTGGNVTIN
ncbi:MAG: hypothetical protein DHS20C19_21670 [Acidimicrobiales bacterium]|nr:MAG: hypothetical protein DHS20C19_21670 [Acidimicrobiales bacterium]